MKRKKLKSPGTCSFCKQRPTEFRIAGYPFDGRTVCDVCWPVLKQNDDEFWRKWKNGDFTKADFSTWLKL